MQENSKKIARKVQETFWRLPAKRRTFAVSEQIVPIPIAKGVRGGLNLTIMENMGLTPSDVMLMTKQHCSHGQSATAIGLAAGLGGGALLLAIAAAWGVNAASKARAKAAEMAVAGNKDALGIVSQFMLSERTSREGWQNLHAPTIRQYVDVQSTAQQGQQSTASATAEALALAAAINQNNGINSAIGNESFLRVQRYSAPQPCPCDNCGN